MPVIEITNMAYGGDALGRLPDGRVAFVSGALPGEIIRVDLYAEKSTHTRARVLEILQPSPVRINPRCPHFGECGGCHYQHIPYDHQLIIKELIIKEQLQRLAGIKEPPLLPIAGSPSSWNYRNSIQFSINPDGKPGFLRIRSHEILPIRECHLPDEEISTAWPCLDLEPGLGINRVEFRSGTGGEVLVVLESPEELPPDMIVDLPLSVVHQGVSGSHLMAGEDHVTIEISGRLFHVSAASFFQVNTLQAAAMVGHICSSLEQNPGETLLDVYCGAGLFSAFLAPYFKQTIGVEMAPSACADYVANMEDFDDVALYEGQVEDILPYLEVKPGVVVVDPPRRGLVRQALDAIVRLQPPTLVYVSCDPATLCRDLKILIQSGYTLDSIKPFDLFPQTFHIETVTILKSNRAGV